MSFAKQMLQIEKTKTASPVLHYLDLGFIVFGCNTCDELFLVARLSVNNQIKHVLHFNFDLQLSVHINVGCWDLRDLQDIFAYTIYWIALYSS